MKKQTLIIIVLCVLVAAVIALSVFGVIGPQGSLAGFTVYPEVLPTATPGSTNPKPADNWRHFPITIP